MTSENLLQAMGYIDPQLITDAAPDLPMANKAAIPWRKWASAVACWCAVAVLSMIFLTYADRELLSDKNHSFYLFGSVTLNVTHLAFAALIAPIFTLVCSFTLWMIRSGSIILPLWLFRDLCLPLLHFCILRRHIKRGKVQSRGTITLWILLAFAAIIADSLIMDFILLRGRLALPHSLFRIIWAIICSMIVLGHSVAEKLYRDSVAGNLAMVGCGVLILAINACATYVLSPTIASKYAIDGIELLLMPLTLILVSSYSYLLGCLMTKRCRIVKIFLWLIGILASEWITIWLLGTPRELPTAHPVTMAIWLAASGICFAWCLLGILRTRLHTKQSPKI